jgi:hypothetical protein
VGVLMDEKTKKQMVCRVPGPTDDNRTNNQGTPCI